MSRSGNGIRGGHGPRRRVHLEYRPPGSHTDGLTRESHGSPGFRKRQGLDPEQEAGVASLAGSAGTHSPNLQLCPAASSGGVASCSLLPEQMTPISTPNGDLELGTGANWYGNPTPDAGDPSGEGGSWYLYDIGAGPGGWSYEGWVGNYTFLAGATYVARMWVEAGQKIWFGDREQDGTSASSDYVEQDVTASGWQCVEWTPSANRTTGRVQVARVSSGTVAVDSLRAYSGGGGANPLAGTSNRAARCDHTHHYFSERDPLVTDDEDAGYRVGTLWIRVDDTSSPTTIVSTWRLVNATAGAAVWIEEVGGGTDLTGIDFLVGTASGDLSNEIVVGTTPGGELGGTWASPTVDAVHSGSAHLALGTTAGTAAEGDHTHGVPTGYYRPVMDGLGNVVTDSGTGAALMAYAED